MSGINFFSEDTNFIFQEAEKASSWLKQLGDQYSKTIGELNIIFCSDEYLHRLNVEYLQHDTLTDIITFPYEESDLVSGDIFISVDRVVENARKFNVSTDIELTRVMGHGLLHLCGFKDKSEAEKKEMKHQEDKAIDLWNQLN